MLFRSRLQAPSGGFNTFTIENNYVGKFRNNKKYTSKKEDPRIFLMRQEENKLSYLSDDEALAQFENCIGNL